MEVCGLATKTGQSRGVSASLLLFWDIWDRAQIAFANSDFDNAGVIRETDTHGLMHARRWAKITILGPWTIITVRWKQCFWPAEGKATIKYTTEEKTAGGGEGGGGRAEKKQHTGSWSKGLKCRKERGCREDWRQSWWVKLGLGAQKLVEIDKSEADGDPGVKKIS